VSSSFGPTGAGAAARRAGAARRELAPQPILCAAVVLYRLLVPGREFCAQRDGAGQNGLQASSVSLPACGIQRHTRKLTAHL
jgi:hypothetical protein